MNAGVCSAQAVMVKIMTISPDSQASTRCSVGRQGIGPLADYNHLSRAGVKLARPGLGLDEPFFLAFSRQLAISGPFHFCSRLDCSSHAAVVNFCAAKSLCAIFYRRLMT